MGGPLKKNEILEDEKGKQVRTKMGGTLNKKEIIGEKKGRRVRTYTDVVSTRRATGQLSNGEEGSKF